MLCWQPCNSHVYFNIFLRSGYLCFATQLVLLFNYKTYGLVPGGFAPYPHWGLRPQTPAISALFFLFFLFFFIFYYFFNFLIFFIFFIFIFFLFFFYFFIFFIFFIFLFFYFFLFFLILQNIWMMLFRRLKKFWKNKFFWSSYSPSCFFSKKIASYIHPSIPYIFILLFNIKAIL